MATNAAQERHDKPASVAEGPALALPTALGLPARRVHGGRVNKKDEPLAAEPGLGGSALSGAWQAIKAFIARLGEDKISILAASVAFYTLLSVFPALSVLVSVYGLIADPADVRTQLDNLEFILPASAIALLSTWLDTLLARPRSSFGLGLLISVALSLWAARNAIGTMMTALNAAYRVADARGIIRYNVAALGLTALLILFGAIAVMLVAIVPVTLNLLPFPSNVESALSLVRWPILAALVVLAIAVTYRFGPNRSERRWEWTSAGALFATTLWIAGSVGFSIYVGQFASYDKTYGSLGAVVVLMLWFWLSAYAVLAGAVLNSVREQRRQTGKGRPIDVADDDEEFL